MDYSIEVILVLVGILMFAIAATLKFFRMVTSDQPCPACKTCGELIHSETLVDVYQCPVCKSQWVV